MSLESRVLKNILEILAEVDWEQEVRYVWLKRIGIYLVALTHPQFALRFIRQAEGELYAPREIYTIFDIFLYDGGRDDKQKIAAIKHILEENGYSAANPSQSWAISLKTHEAYKKIAEEIHNYEAEYSHQERFAQGLKTSW